MCRVSYFVVDIREMGFVRGLGDADVGGPIQETLEYVVVVFGFRSDRGNAKE